MKIERMDGRRCDELRRLSVNYNVCEFAASSVLFQMGRTKVLCAVSLQQGVPPFLRGKQRGWLTAEYAMLPASTPTRTTRESSSAQRSGRSVEISRFIGRSLRSIIDFDELGERTIVIDCDVIQADGGTRTACISASYLALRAAVDQWISQQIITTTILRDAIAAVSIGLIADSILLDLTYEEDTRAHADFNIVLTKTGSIVEIQGAAEQAPVAWKDFHQLCTMAQLGIQQLFTFFDAPANKAPLIKPSSVSLTQPYAE